MVGTVYLITNTHNTKSYVGITTMQLGRRWSCHKRDAKNKKYPLYYAMRKYGIDCFSIREIKTINSTSKEELLELLNNDEMKYVKIYNGYIGWKSGGYNLTIGGSMKNISVESRKKQSETMRRKFKQNPALGKTISNRIKEFYKKNPMARKDAGRRSTERYKDSKYRKMMGDSIQRALSDPAVKKRYSEAQILFNKNNPEKGRSHSRQISGKNHPRLDNTIYKFENMYSGETFEGCRFDFYNLHKISKDKICEVVHGKRNHHRGWKLIKSS